jgi:TnpA family transposase
MPTESETAYPRFKSTVTDRELREVYTPTPDERELARQHTTGDVAQVAFLTLLKTFQRLGYAVSLTAVPVRVVDHVASQVGLTITTGDLIGYDASGTRRRHLRIIRTHLGISAYGPEAQAAMEQAMAEAALGKDDLTDLINIALEEMVRQQWELPTFSAFSRAATKVRSRVNNGFHAHIGIALTDEHLRRIDQLFVTDPQTHESSWNQLREDPGKPNLKHLRELLDHINWLTSLQIATQALAKIPDVKIKRFAAEAQTLDASRMQNMRSRKRYTLALCLLTTQYAQALDDLAEMVIKRLMRLHQQGKEAFEAYRNAQQKRIDELILVLRDVTVAYRGEGTDQERMEAIDAAFGGESANVLLECETHLAFVTNTYYPFLRKLYGSYRALLFKFLNTVVLRSSHQDTALETTIAFLKENETRTGNWLPICSVEKKRGEEPSLLPLVDLSWMSDVWWRIVSGQSKRTPLPERVDRRHFEICVFSQILWDLKTGDLSIEGSDLYANIWAQGISWEEYTQQVNDYGAMLGVPVDGPGFVNHMRTWLDEIAREVDANFLNAQVTIEKGEPIIHKQKKKRTPPGLKELEAILAERLNPFSLLDILSDTQFWLDWCQDFGPISGLETKLADAIERYLVTVFAYGTQLGPSETARSLPDIDRRQIAWIHQRHITEENLERAITRLTNAYVRFELPRRWGSAKRASADGTKWEIYVQNLLAEYHVRYGGYGGIAYYHVSDTYIALFSRFIPCSVWEAVYILDGLMSNQSEMKPNEVSGDTQAQNAVVFGLAHLLGIRLMPRIRNLKDLTLYRPDPANTYVHIDELFQGTVDWDLIATHLPDMLRIALSIKAGRMTASTILRKLSSYSHKNRLYQAFRELGRVVRTGFVLQYLADPELRATIQQATNKSEAFNHLVQWLAFGNMGVIPTNNRAEQRKYIKYNHLLANAVILVNTAAITKILSDLTKEGYVVHSEAVVALSPYITQHIIRFGRFALDRTRKPLPLDFDLPLFSREEIQEVVEDVVTVSA